MNFDSACAGKSSIAFRALVLLISDWRSNALFAHIFGNDWKLLAGEVDKCHVLEALLNVDRLVVVTSVSVKRLVTLEHHFAVTTLGGDRRMFLVHVIFQIDHAGEVVADTYRAAKLLLTIWRHNVVVIMVHGTNLTSIVEIIIGAFSFVWKI